MEDSTCEGYQKMFELNDEGSLPCPVNPSIAEAKRMEKVEERIVERARGARMVLRSSPVKAVTRLCFRTGEGSKSV